MHKKIIVTVLIAVLTMCVHRTYAVAPIETINNRAAIIDTYFKNRHMPLSGYGNEMIMVADKYNLDWRLLPAIAVRESSGGKHMCKNNPYGYGSCKITFTSITAATETVGKVIAGYTKGASIYKNTDTKEKLYYYNGTIVPTYPGEVMAIMSSISHER